MEKDNLLLIIACGAFLISLFSLTSFLGVLPLTGFATTQGTVNVTVQTQTLLNFTSNNINFGNGRVNAGESSATLYAGNASVSDGSWSYSSQLLVLENIGNTEVSLDIGFGKTAADLLGGTGPSYKYWVTNSEAGSCTAPGGTPLETWRAAHTSATTICDNFDFENANDEISIDLSLVIPSDSKTGSLGDVITITYANV